MGVWGADAKARNESALETAIRWLNPTAKQAFYGAAASRTIARRTWNGCAFNAGGEELGINGVKSVAKAAEVFGIKPYTVQKFIVAWDSLTGTDEHANNTLQELILKVGLFTPAGSRGLRKIVVKVFDSTMDQSEERATEIQNLVADETVTDSQLHELIEGYSEAAELLCV